jgi:D-methionine transport system ATP-binding protein
MIRLEQITKSYRGPGQKGFTAVSGVSLEIRTGETFGLLGSSGAGKSTLLRTINLLERPDSGRIYFQGQELTALPPSQIRKQRQKIGMIFQHSNLISNQTAAENVAFPLKVAGWSKADISIRVRECLAKVGLGEKAQNYPAQLSGGQRQRVGIARAIANHPLMLLADEPTSSLDPVTRQEVITSLLEIQKAVGLTQVLVTHEADLVRKMCHRAALIDQGKLVEIVEFFGGKSKATTAVGRAILGENLCTT